MDYIQKLKAYVSRFRVGMLGTVEDGMNITFRPMSHVNIDDVGNIWFFISTRSDQAKNIENNPEIHLFYIKESDNIYLSIRAIAHLNHDKNRIREIYNPFVKAWFPKGIRDPSLALLMVQPYEAEYWTNTEGRLTSSQILLPSSSVGRQAQNREVF